MANILSIASIIIGVIILVVLLTKKAVSQDLGNMERATKEIKDEFSRNRSGNEEQYKNLRLELAANIQNLSDSLIKQLERLTESNEKRFELIRNSVESKLKDLQEDNTKKLEQMRQTVDEKLHATLEKRLGESFKLVGDRLDLVHKGLGEMQTLAAGVGDLKKVLSNVKTRGTWGEVQIANLLEEILTPEQYETNIATKPGSRDRVEFAIKFPGRDKNVKHLYLPIDAKFPLEDYHQLNDAQENGDRGLIESLGKALAERLKQEAKDIHDKYIDPPHTTDFGILFLPVESLYAEVQRNGALVEKMRREYKVIVAGPSNLYALLISLQMGFRTLAIEKRSSEVWALLESVKTEFGHFGDILDKTHKKLQEASNNIETASSKSRTIERKLNKVQQLPQAEEGKEGELDEVVPPRLLD